MFSSLLQMRGLLPSGTALLLLSAGCSSYESQVDRDSLEAEEESTASQSDGSDSLSNDESGVSGSGDAGTTSGGTTSGGTNAPTCESFQFTDAPQSPSDLTELSHWRLELPIALGDDVERVEWPDLCGFEESPHFHLNAASDSILFRAAVDAGTTEGSSYPRSELREMDGFDRAYWNIADGVHTMEIRQRINSVPPAKPHIVAGQIHDDDDDVVMVRFEEDADDKLFVESRGDSIGTLDADYRVGEWFRVKIVATGGAVSISYAADGEDYGTPVTRDLECLSETGVPGRFCYFKAGAYTQSNLEKGDVAGAYGEVEISSLTVTHE